MTGWRYFFPDGGEGPDDAREFPNPSRVVAPYAAAQMACELDYSRHDGWERGSTPFAVAVIGPTGQIHKFRAWHEPSVDHRVSEDV